MEQGYLGNYRDQASSQSLWASFKRRRMLMTEKTCQRGGHT